MENILSIISHFENKSGGSMYSNNCSVHRDETGMLYITKSYISPDEDIGINSRMKQYDKQEDTEFSLIASIIANELSDETASLATFFYQEGFKEKTIISPNKFQGMHLFLYSRPILEFISEKDQIKTEFSVFCADPQIKKIVSKYLRMVT